jgi:neutral ceramidase
MRQIAFGFIILCLLSSLGSIVIADEATWRVGVAKINITPELPIWLSGYGGRTKPAATKLDDLWAKALVLEDARGKRAVLVTVDLVGVGRDLSQEVCRRVEEKYDVPRSAIALCASHTHSGPIVRENLAAMFALNEEEAARVRRYGDTLPDKLIEAVDEAFESIAPSSVRWTIGKATFAVNRRNNSEGQVPKLREQNALQGPVDHDVPVLVVKGADGKLRAIVAGYACHATVLSGYEVSADWPGAFQNEFERRHPGTIAMYWEGCGGDQNPLPRRSVELMNIYGRELADSVDAVLEGELTPVPPELETEYEEIALPFATLPTRAELQTEAAGMPPRSRWASYLLAKWDREGDPKTTYPYPVQAWRLGPDLTWIFLGGEVVVDYSLRLKSELDERIWVASYANDVMGYIASRRVLAEGGYEGAESRIPYGLPAVWDPKIEQQIVDAVHQVAKPD